MKDLKKILIIIQRSNGDVFLSSSLIKALYEHYGTPDIDLLVNDDTKSVAKLIPYISNIYTFSYEKKKNKRWSQEKSILLQIFKKYDLSINLTSSDRSVIYALMSGKKSISAIEADSSKSWWKRLFLNHYYVFDEKKHILENNFHSLDFLNITYDKVHYEIKFPKEEILIKKKLANLNITKFIIFHPSAQYKYKIYPKLLRNKLLFDLNKLGIPILITGSNNQVDLDIKKNLPTLENVYDFIGETSLKEFIALSKLSLCYVGMDTLNIHIAAAQNKHIFGIFGPTNLRMWSPWSNLIRCSAFEDKPMQNYGNFTIFQANMPCVACGKAGCDDNHGNSDCLDNINPFR